MAYHPTWDKIKPLSVQLLVCVIIGLVGWFGVRPLLSSIHEKQDDIQKLSATRTYRETRLLRLHELEAQYALIGTGEERLNIILTKERLVEFIETLERLADEEKVEITLESRDNAFLESKVTTTAKKEENAKRAPGASEDAKTGGAAESVKGGGNKKETGIMADLPLKQFLKLTITLSGEYRDIVRYLSRLETLSYALDVVGISMKAREEEGNSRDSRSSVPSPFDGVAPVVVPEASSHAILNAVLETVVYMKD